MRLDRQQCVLAGGLGLGVHAHQPRLAGAIDISIQQAHVGPIGLERQRQVGSDSGFAHAALGRSHGDDISHAVDALDAGLHGPRLHRETDRHIGLCHAVNTLERGLDLFGQPLAVIATGETHIELERDVPVVDVQRTHGSCAGQIGVQMRFVNRAQFGFDVLSQRIAHGALPVVGQMMMAAMIPIRAASAVAADRGLAGLWHTARLTRRRPRHDHGTRYSRYIRPALRQRRNASGPHARAYPDRYLGAFSKTTR